MAAEYQDITYDELSKLIVKAIDDEPFLNKQTLIPKIKAIIKGFRINLSIINVQRLQKNGKIGKLALASEENQMAKLFWKQKLEAYVTKEQMQQFYIELDELKTPLKVTNL